VASQGGMDPGPQWYRNLMAHPDTSVQIKAEVRRVRARVATAEEAAALWPRLDAVYEDFVNYRRWTDRSRTNLGVDTLDLVQLHCPPTAVFHRESTYDDLDVLVSEGRIAAYVVWVETVDEALAAIARPHVATVQIILNVFRRKPLDQVLPAAAAAGVGIIARVPLASGLLSGKYDATTTFDATDHRSYNRHGEAFDVGETFAGVPFEVGVEAAAAVAALTPSGATTAQLALRWIVDQPGVSVVIPGARNASQARANAAAADIAPLSGDVLDALREIYDERIAEHVAGRW